MLVGRNASTGEKMDGPVSTTLALTTYSMLRDEIVNGELMPGRKLRIRDLCERFGIGLSPMREALSRLASDGWVVQSAQRGFSVADFSLRELEELVRTKKWLNEIGLRESIRHGDVHWEESVILAYHRLARAPRQLGECSKRNSEWNRAHATYHASLIAACGSEWLRGYCDELYLASERYRIVARPRNNPQARLDEHKAIMEAVVSRDADRAVLLLNQHFDVTVELVRARLLEQGAGFKDRSAGPA